MESGQIKEAIEIFIFTDNYVAERAFYRGNSRSPTLFELILRLNRLVMTGKIMLHVVWVSGKRMIAQGTDGLSRGDLSNVPDGRTWRDPVKLRALDLVDGRPGCKVGWPRVRAQRPFQGRSAG